MADKILAQFARQSLKNNSGEDNPTLRKVLGASKMVTGPHYQGMTEAEVEKDVTKLNTYIAFKKSNKKMVSHIKVISDAKTMQKDFYMSEAKKKEAQFRKKEDQRQRVIQRKADRLGPMSAHEDELRKKRNKESDKLNKGQKGVEQKKINIGKAIKEDIYQTVKDMPID